MWLKYCPLIAHNSYELFMNFTNIIIHVAQQKFHRQKNWPQNWLTQWKLQTIEMVTSTKRCLGQLRLAVNQSVNASLPHRWNIKLNKTQNYLHRWEPMNYILIIHAIVRMTWASASWNSRHIKVQMLKTKLFHRESTILALAESSKCGDHIFIWFQTPHFISHFFHTTFLSRENMSPTNWPALNCVTS